jgi:hypothetical protein
MREVWPAVLITVMVLILVAVAFGIYLLTRSF